MASDVWAGSKDQLQRLDHIILLTSFIGTIVMRREIFNKSWIKINCCWTAIVSRKNAFNTDKTLHKSYNIYHDIYSCEVFERYYKSKIPFSLRESPLNDNDWLMVCQHCTMRQQKCQQYLINNISYRYLRFARKEKDIFLPNIFSEMEIERR